jgi:tetratricopeptide (TPR) repeat protein
MGGLARLSGNTMNLDAWRHYLRGRLFQRLRQTDRALAEYRAALKHDPRHTRAAHAAAFLLAGAKRWTEAREALQRVLHINPRNTVAWFNLGYVAEQLGDLDAATEAFRAAVGHDPRSDRAWYGLGLALATRGNTQEAVASFEQAAKLQPMNGHVWYQLGLCHHKLHDADKVKSVVQHLDRFDRHMAKRLIVDTGRSDLAHVVADLQKLR